MAVATRDFFQTLSNKAVEAEKVAGGATERCYALADLRLTLRFLGEALIPKLCPAIAHLEVAPDGVAPNLVIHCWDCMTLGLDSPHAPVQKNAFTPRGEILGLNDTRFQTAFSPFARQLSMVDLDRCEAFYCVGNATLIPRFEEAEPIRALLAWVLRANGRQVIHAGAVGRAEGGVLLLGRSGAGKSITSLSCLQSGLSYAADDFCAISTGPAMAYSIYCTGKTHYSDWTQHPFLATLPADVDPEGREKNIYYLHDSVPEKLIAAFPIRAILLLGRGRDGCQTRPVAASAALALCAPDTAMLIPGSGAEVLTGLARLVREVPCYTFDLGIDPMAVPPAIATLVSELNASAVRVT